MGEVQRLIKVFTEEQAARLAKISAGQIRYWDQTGFFVPTISEENRRLAYSRLYSFDDVVALRVLGKLRNEFDVPLQHLRRVRDRFSMGQNDWKEEEIYVHERKVYFAAERDNYLNGETGEETLPKIPLPQVITDITAEVKRMGMRPREARGMKSRTTNVAKRGEVFAGTRIPVDVVKEYFDAGLKTKDILSDYPTLTEKDVDAAIKWFGIEAA